MAKRSLAVKKPVANKAKGQTKVTAKDKDPLADLGLSSDEGSGASAGTTTQTTTVTTEGGDGDGREEVVIGDLEFGTIDFIPTAKRTGGGSKYKFDTLAAPKKNEATGKIDYAFFIAKLEQGVDEDKLRRSVQSATTQANRQGKPAGKYFVSRSVSKEGKFVGMQVIRTDQPPKD